MIWLGIIVVGVILYGFLLRDGGGKRGGKLARSYWGKGREIERAKRQGLKQIAKPKRNAAALYIGMDIERFYERVKRYCALVSQRLESEDYRQSHGGTVSIFFELYKLCKGGAASRRRERFYIPDIQRGIAVCGAPGSGKTFSVIDPSLRSALEQGHPVILYDFKYPDQANTLAVYAKFFCDYDVYFFAPGYDESNICNPLEFIRHPLDGETARQIAVVMNKNFSIGSSDKRDPFFDSAADQLLEAVFMLVRSFRLADLLSCQAILSLDDLANRLMQWSDRSLECDIALAFLADSQNVYDFYISAPLMAMAIQGWSIEHPESQLNILECLHNFLRQVREYGDNLVKDAKRNGKLKRSVEEGSVEYIEFLAEVLPRWGDIPKLIPFKGSEFGGDYRKFVGQCFEETLRYLDKVKFNLEISYNSGLISNDVLTAGRDNLSFIQDILVYYWRLSPDYNPYGEYLRTKRLKDWLKAAFGQIMSVGRSEKTLSSILGIANNNLTRFVKPNISRHFVGETTMPLYADKRMLFIFGLDRERRDTVGPLLATVLHLIVNYNLMVGKGGERRSCPLVVALDELPTLYLPQLQNWLNESRSDGFCGQIGFQNMNQLEKAYGKESARAILTGCNTKFLFNPGEPDSAENFSKILGEEEILLEQRSRTVGGKGGATTNISKQERTRKLFEPAQFLKLPTGTCVAISPAYANESEASVPILRAMKLSTLEINIFQELSKLWPHLRRQQIEKVGGHQLQDERLDLAVRQRFISNLFTYKKPEPEY